MAVQRQKGLYQSQRQDLMQELMIFHLRRSLLLFFEDKGGRKGPFLDFDS